MVAYKILLVDDDPLILKSIGLNLRKKGYQVTSVDSGEKAIELLNKDTFDLVITDLVMEPVDGIGVLKKAKQINPEIMVMVLSGYADMASAVKTFRVGADDYLAKPCEPAEMHFRIERCFEKLENRKKIKQAQEAQKKEFQMRTSLLDNIPGCFALILKKGSREIVASNKFAQETGAVPGKTCYKTCAMRDDSCSFCLAPKLWETDELQRTEAKINGSWYEVFWAPLSNDLYVHYIFDITERKQTEQERESLVD